MRSSSRRGSSGPCWRIDERAADGYWVHAPDIPGCISFGESRAEALASMREAVEGHLVALRAQGIPAPEPSDSVDSVEVAVDLAE